MGCKKWIDEPLDVDRNNGSPSEKLTSISASDIIFVWIKNMDGFWNDLLMQNEKLNFNRIFTWQNSWVKSICLFTICTNI